MQYRDSQSSCGCSCTSVIIGAIAGACMSWVFNHSVFWMVFHGLLGWFYLLYKIPWYVMTTY